MSAPERDERSKEIDAGVARRRNRAPWSGVQLEKVIDAALVANEIGARQTGDWGDASKARNATLTNAGSSVETSSAAGPVRAGTCTRFAPQ